MQGSRYYHEAMAVERDSWASQLRKGVLELAVLALLDSEPKYGSQLVEELAAVPSLVITVGTVYPLLARLAKAGALTTSWQESRLGPPRKYYSLTPAGRTRLQSLAAEFTSVSQAMSRLLGGLS